MASETNRLHPLSGAMIPLQRGVTGLSIPVFLAGIAPTVLGVDADFAVDLLFVVAPLGFVVGVGYGLAYYYRFAYALAANTFDVTSGVFSQRAREIPYRRVQNVDVSQGIVQRLLGLAVVSIETAGGGSTEATLRFVSSGEADRIRSEIRRRTAAVDDASDAAEGPAATDSASETAGKDVAESRSDSGAARGDRSTTLLFELEVGELLVYAATAFRWGAAVFPILLVTLLTDADSGAGFLPDFAFETARTVGGPESIDGAPVDALLVLAAVAALQWLVAAYVASALYTIVNYYGFRLGRWGNDLLYERGLLRRYSGSIPTDKIQSVTITDNPLQRLVGYAGLWVETAGYGPETTGGNQSAVPMAARSRIYRFATALTGADRPDFRGASPLARRRYLVRYSLLAVGVVALAFGASRVTGLERWYLAAVAVAAAPPAAHLKYVNIGYHTGDEHIVIRRGFWRRRTTVIPYYRVQTLSTRRSIFQRRLGLASLVVDTASSRTFSAADPTIDDVDLETARTLHETCGERLQTALRDRAGDDVGLPVDPGDRP